MLPWLLVNTHPGSTLVFRIEVQDILIIFQHFSSQDILIRDRTVINFGKISRNQFNSSRKPSEQVKNVAKTRFKMQKCLPRTFIQGRTFIKLEKISPQDVYSGQDVY